MPSLDGVYYPFDDYPGWSAMAPCMRSCDHDVSFNGCDKAACWCNKGNLDLRIASMTRCASSSCTFANMNTATDVTMLSGIQVEYCVDRSYSPPGMALPSSVDAVATETGGSFVTGTAAATGTRTRSVFGPTGSSATSSNTNNVGSSLLSTAAKTGIGIGVSACALLAILIVLLILRRRRPPPTYYPPPPSYGIAPPPNMAPTPYSGNGPFSPPPIQQPIPMHAGQQQGGYATHNMGDVSPIEEKAVPAVTTTPKVLRKEVGGGKLGRKSTTDISVATPPGTPRSQQPPPSQNPIGTGTAYAHETDGPREVAGSVPPQRHEVGNEGQITNTVSTRGMELDGQQLQSAPNQYPGQQSYQQSAQGYPYYNPGTGGVPHEVDGGRNEWAQRQELPANSALGRGAQGYGAPYEMPGR